MQNKCAARRRSPGRMHQLVENARGARSLRSQASAVAVASKPWHEGPNRDDRARDGYQHSRHGTGSVVGPSGRCQAGRYPLVTDRRASGLWVTEPSIASRLAGLRRATRLSHGADMPGRQLDWRMRRGAVPRLGADGHGAAEPATRRPSALGAAVCPRNVEPGRAVSDGELQAAVWAG